jgi:hypothetical protein
VSSPAKGQKDEALNLKTEYNNDNDDDDDDDDKFSACGM